MQNICKICKDITDYFDGNVEPDHMVHVLLDKLEAYVKSKYNVPDWTGEYTWALHLVEHIRSTPLTKIKTDWITEQIHKEALREIREDGIVDHVFLSRMQLSQG